MASASVGIRDLKANLSRHLRRVGAGATLQVTARGRVIATIAPVAPKADLAWANQLVAEGKAHWAGGKPGASRSPAKLSGRGMTASDMVLEDRR